MFVLIPIPVKRRWFSLDREFVALADRETMLKAAKQVFDELGLRIHKQTSSEMVHWRRGFGRATPIVAAMVNELEEYYRLNFRSLGTPSLTSLRIQVQMPFSIWPGSKQRAEERIRRFMDKLDKVSAEHGIRYKE